MKPTFIHGAMIVGLGLLAGPACSAHHPGAYHHGDAYTDYARGHRVAYDRGYHHGVEAGARDWRHHRRFDPLQHGRYRSGDWGYSSRYGPRPSYCRSYRAGFRAGYDRAFGPPRGHRGYGRYTGPRR